jgi:hypothetical protein
MRIKLVPEMTRMFCIAAITAFPMFAVGCSILNDIFGGIHGFPGCSDPSVTIRPDGTADRACTCSTAECQSGRADVVQVCCRTCGTCMAETTNAQCQMQAMGTPLVTVPGGLIVDPSLPNECQPFRIVWRYYNAGNKTLQPPQPPSMVVFEITEEEPTDVPDDQKLPFVRNVPWKVLQPCEHDDKSVDLPQGIKLHPRDTSGGFRATILDSSTRNELASMRFIVGLAGSDCR